MTTVNINCHMCKGTGKVWVGDTASNAQQIPCPCTYPKQES